MERRQSKLIKNSVILLIGSLLTKGINFLMAPLFIRWMPSADYGTFDLLATYSMLLIPVFAMGSHHAVFRFLLDDESYENRETILTNVLLINGIGILCYMLFMGGIMVCFDKITPFLYQLFILLVAQTLQNLVGMYLRGIKKLEYYTITNIILTISIFVFVFLFVKGLNLGLNGMVYGYTVAYLLYAIVGICLSGTRKIFVPKLLSLSKQKEILKYSIPMIPSTIAWWIVSVSDRVIVSSVLGVTYNAILAIAHKLPNLCVTLYDSLHLAWNENAAETINDSDWDDYLSNILNNMAMLCISISIIIINTNFFIYDLLFTSEYVIGKNLVPILCIAIVFSSLSQSLGSVFVAEYDSKKQGGTMLFAAAINAILHMLLINAIGIYASVVSTLIAYIILFLIRYLYIKRKYDIHMKYTTYIVFFLMIFSAFASYLNNTYINLLMLLISVVLIILLNYKILYAVVKGIVNKVLEIRG